MVVGTDHFEGLVRAVAGSLGAPWLPLVTVPHPIGGIAPTAVIEKIDAVERRLVAALLGEDGS